MFLNLKLFILIVFKCLYAVNAPCYGLNLFMCKDTYYPFPTKIQHLAVKYKFCIGVVHNKHIRRHIQCNLTFCIMYMFVSATLDVSSVCREIPDNKPENQINHTFLCPYVCNTICSSFHECLK